MQMEITTLGYYLIIAKYDRNKWKSLNNVMNLGSDTTDNHKEAEDRARGLFPYQRRQSTTTPANKPVVLDEAEAPESYELKQGLPLPYPPGVLLVHTFHSGIHAKLPYDKFESMSSEQWEAELDRIFAAFDPHESPPETDVKDPGIGWIAVVHRDSLDQFVETMGGKEGALWKMYDPRVIPLSDDTTTYDIYRFMTPVHWK